MQKREKGILTFGQQLNQNTLKQMSNPDRQEVGETVAEMGEKFLKGINNAIENARKKGIKGKIYIHVIERPMQFARNAVQHTIIVRRSRPTPEQCTYLYSHEEGDIKPKFEYCLPELNHVGYVMSHQHKFSKKYIQDITKWLDGKLN